MSFTTSRRVEFRDTDAAGIVHFSAFFPMMETAEHEMLRSLGLSALPRPSGDPSAAVFTWPRVAAHCEYFAAARFEDLLTITVRVAKIGNTSVEYHYRFDRDDCRIAEGRMTAVCCRLKPPAAGGGGGHEVHLEKMAIPDSVRELLSRHQ
jgi:4-hydroxybenzoyl-CoA thioesterase/acyl-CoA thioester hydrolase